MDSLLEKDLDVHIAMIQELIPIGLMAVNNIFQEEVIQLVSI